MIQPHKSGDYHAHADREQVYYFTQGRGKMNIDEVVYEVQRGDAVSALLALPLLQLSGSASASAFAPMPPDRERRLLTGLHPADVLPPDDQR